VLEDGTEVVLHSIIGDPVWTGDETIDPKRTLLTEVHQGTFADTVVVPARNALPKPPGLSFAEAACMGTTWLTAYRMLFVKSGLLPGQTMLIQGASGGVSTALIALAGRRHARLGHRPHRRQARPRHRTRRARHLRVRRPPARTGRRRLRNRRQSHLGPFHAVPAPRRNPGGLRRHQRPRPSADLARVYFLQLNVIAPRWHPQRAHRPAQLLRSANLRPRIGAQLPFTEAKEGITQMLNGDTAGKIVFTRP